MTIGEKIKYLRISKNLTQQDLATITNTTKQTIWKYETGKVTNIPLDRITALAAALDTTEGELTGWEKKPDIKSERQALISIIDTLSDDEVHLLLSMLKNRS